MIRLKPITKENYRGCIELKTTKEQEKFVAPNWYSLLEAVYEEARQAFAIYHQEEMIGFLLFSYYEADEDYAKESWWIERFMIDHRFQQKDMDHRQWKQRLNGSGRRSKQKNYEFLPLKKIRSLNKCTKVLDLLQLESL